jgi:thiol-disulfide isomerase/thioredoxin
VLRWRRRTVVVAAAVLAGVLVVVLLVTIWPGGGSSATSEVDGSKGAVLYSAGHRPAAPDFTATTLTGSGLNFASYRGKVVVLNFWGSWCVPCRAEASTLADLAAQYQAAGVSFLGVDVRDTTASAEAFVHSFGVSYPSVNDASSAVTLDFSSVVPIAGTPTTLVIDRTGHIAGAVFGSITYSELNTILTSVTGKAG